MKRLEFHVPSLHQQADVTEIIDALENSPGVESYEVDHVGQRVVVVTSNSDAGVDVRRTLSEAGFPPE